MNVIWNEYVDPPLASASSADVNNLELVLEVKLPQDYKDFIVLNQGKYPSKETVVCGQLSSSTFGPVFHIFEECLPEQKLYSVIAKWKKWSDVYEGLVPIADSGGTGCFFAYDYRNSEENPPVVFVDVEEDPDDGVLYVSKNLSELINALA